MSGKTNKAGIGLIIAAVVILLLGLGLGVNRLCGGIATYQERPSMEEIAGRYELLDNLEELQEILSDTRNPEELDGDAMLRDWLEDTRMSRWQQKELRENIETVLELAQEGSVGLETARNHLIREQMHIRSLLNDREDAERQLRYAILFAGGCIGISALVAVPMLVAAGKKRRQAAQAVVSSDVENYDNKEL